MEIKTILIIGGGKEAIEGIKVAKRMGLKVVVSDYDVNAPGFSYADDKIIASTYHPEETVEAIKKYPGKIDQVVTIGCDATRTVAAVADYLNIPGPTKETAFLSTEKFEMKKKFQQDNVRIPWFKDINSLDDLKKVIDEKGYPLVLKPVDNRGARGVLKLTKDVNLNEAYEHSLKNSFSGKLIVEEWIEGPQFSSESVIWDGEIVTPLIAYRNYARIDEFSPYIIEDGGHMPAELTKEQMDEVDRLLLNAANSIGHKRGIIKGDLVYSNNKFMIIEVAARLSGGNYSTLEIPLCTGVNIVEAAIQVSGDQKPDFENLKPEKYLNLVQRYIFLKPGKIVSIKGVDEAKSLPGVEFFTIYVKEGDVVNPISDHSKRNGMIIVSGDSKESAMNTIKKVFETLKIEVE